MTKKSFPADQTPIQAELRHLSQATRGLSRRGLQRLAAGAATTTLLLGLNASPALAATTIDCPPDQLCSPSLESLIVEGQAAQSQAQDKWLPLASFYKDAALKFETYYKEQFLKLDGIAADKEQFLKLYQDAHKLQDGALFLKIRADDLYKDGLKLYKDATQLDEQPTDSLSLNFTRVKLDYLDQLGLKIDGLEASLNKDADGLQAEYNTLLVEFQGLSGPPKTIG